ncbi:AT-hook motif nuclear-localized protein 10-like [Phragmites australis]|uniref:AT-hook motif nuclear-localized protein 10-like n=1 Tax=Phragmites australis TaxID=29695 RepID=UPI002D79FFF6|nr:AT-hook motif nuclear-localized protein 10-like [Phragmites australis]
MMEVRTPSSEQGVMAGREPFGLPKSPPAPPSSGALQSVRMAYTTDGTPVFTPVSSAPPATATYQPLGGGGGGAAGPNMTAAGGNGGAPAHPGSAGEPVAKKKRGRPRKYGPDGSMSLALVPASTVAAPAAPGASGPFSPEGAKAPNTAPSASPDGAKKKGRPKGSTNKKHVPALGSAGAGFTPHVIFVKAGEDVSAKIMSFSQHGRRAVCVLSANGAISNVTLRQSATSGGTVTYEGRFEILSLSGSFLLSENGGHHSRTGGLSVSLAGPDGRVLGGGVAGLLTAASPVQIVVGSFNANGKKEPKQQQFAPSEPSSAPSKLAPMGGTAGPSSSPSRGTMSLSESSGGPGSPPHPGATAGGNRGQQSGGFFGLSWK